MAKEFYGYFDPTEADDRQYSADEFAEAFRVTGGTGVGYGLTAAPAGGLKVEVSPGSAMIYGYTYALADDGGPKKTFTLAASGSADRLDRIILRLDLSSESRNIVMMVLPGTPGAAPVAQGLTNTALIKDISLCQVRVKASASAIAQEDIVDERLDPALCGLPVPPPLQIPALESRLDGRYADRAALDALNADAVLKSELVNHLDETEAGKALDAVQGNALGQRMNAVETGKAAAKSFTASLPVAGWSASAPYTQTVNVTGLLETMTPFADVSLSATASTAKAQLAAWAMVGKLTTGAGKLTAICYEQKPTTALTVRLISIQ